MASRAQIITLLSDTFHFSNNLVSVGNWFGRFVCVRSGLRPKVLSAKEKKIKQKKDSHIL